MIIVVMVIILDEIISSTFFVPYINMLTVCEQRGTLPMERNIIKCWHLFISLVLSVPLFCQLSKHVSHKNVVHYLKKNKRLNLNIALCSKQMSSIAFTSLHFVKVVSFCRGRHRVGKNLTVKTQMTSCWFWNVHISQLVPSRRAPQLKFSVDFAVECLAFCKTWTKMVQTVFSPPSRRTRAVITKWLMLRKSLIFVCFSWNECVAVYIWSQVFT